VREMAKTVAIIGHSHAAALGRAIAADEFRQVLSGLRHQFGCVQIVREIHTPQLVDTDDGTKSINPILATEINRLNPTAIVSAIAGNAHNVIGLVNHPVRFDFVIPDEPNIKLDSDAEILPYGAVKEVLRVLLEPHLQLLMKIKATWPIPLYHVQSPPPVPSEEHIRRYPEAFAPKISELGIAPLALRHKLWRTTSHIIEERCEEHGIMYLPVPTDVQDAQGALKEKFWNADATHGNTLYGLEILKYLDVSLKTEHH
jgi:hypothetical protein